LATDGSQDLAVPAADGTPSLLKYAFNMIGTGPGQAQNVNVSNNQNVGPSGTAGLPSTTTNSNGTLAVTYIRRKASATPGITYQVEFRDDLTTGSWSTNGSATESVTSLDATFERVTLTDTVSGGKRFARVSVSVVP
jgi:hypothetical protein